MRWDRAVHHVGALARACAEMADNPVFSVRVTQLWAVGDILGPAADLEFVTVALCVNLPPEDVAWWTEPRGSGHWAQATRLAKNPFLAWWRSDRAPVWNHRIVRPALVWDAADGEHSDVLTALAEGKGESVRTAAPTEEEYASRLQQELTVSREALRAASATYEARRWGQGKLESIADPLWRASNGYFDVLDAINREA